MQFGIDSEQHKQALSWATEHDCALTRSTTNGEKDVGAIGGQIGYKFIPTNLGTIEIVFCACGKEHNLTRFEEW